MKIFAIVQLELPDPVPAPDAPNVAETGFQLPDLTPLARTLDRTLQALPANLAELSIQCHSVTIAGLAVSAPAEMPPERAWEIVAQPFLGAIFKAAPQLPGLLAVPVLGVAAAEAQRQAMLIALRNTKSTRDNLGFRVDLVNAANNAAYGVMTQTAQALSPFVEIAMAAQQAQAAANAKQAEPQKPQEPETAGVG